MDSPSRALKICVRSSAGSVRRGLWVLRAGSNDKGTGRRGGRDHGRRWYQRGGWRSGVGCSFSRRMLALAEGASLPIMMGPVPTR